MQFKIQKQSNLRHIDYIHQMNFGSKMQFVGFEIKTNNFRKLNQVQLLIEEHKINLHANQLQVEHRFEIQGSHN